MKHCIFVLCLGWLSACAATPAEEANLPVEQGGAALGWSFTVEADEAIGVGENDLTVTIALPDGAPADGATVTLALLHLAHGHGGEGPRSITETAPGVYRVLGLGVTMSGLWACTVTATRDGQTDHAAFEWDVL